MLLTSFATSFVAPASRLSVQQRTSAPCMGSTSDFKNGLTLEFENSVWKITNFLHVKPGKGPAFVRSTLKNLENGKTLDKTWRAGEKFGDAQIDKSECQVCRCTRWQHGEIVHQQHARLDPHAAADRLSRQFSYDDADDMVFMNMETYEEERIPRGNIDKAEFIVPEMDVTILRWQDKAIDVQIGKTVVLKVRGALLLLQHGLLHPLATHALTHVCACPWGAGGRD